MRDPVMKMVNLNMDVETTIHPLIRSKIPNVKNVHIFSSDISDGDQMTVVYICETHLGDLINVELIIGKKNTLVNIQQFTSFDMPLTFYK